LTGRTRQTTLCSVFDRRSSRCLPINPVPPVIKIFIFILENIMILLKTAFLNSKPEERHA
jgi:hypothetical protein